MKRIAHPASRSSPNDRKDLLDPVRGERGGRFVQDQQARLAVNGLGDLDELPVGEGKVGNGGRQGNMIAADAIQRRTRRPTRLCVQ